MGGNGMSETKAAQIVAGIEDLPTLPEVVIEITRLVESPDTSADDIFKHRLHGRVALGHDAQARQLRLLRDEQVRYVPRKGHQDPRLLDRAKYRPRRVRLRRLSHGQGPLRLQGVLAPQHRHGRGRGRHSPKRPGSRKSASTSSTASSTTSASWSMMQYLPEEYRQGEGARRRRAAPGRRGNRGLRLHARPDRRGPGRAMGFPAGPRRGHPAPLV